MYISKPYTIYTVPDYTSNPLYVSVYAGTATAIRYATTTADARPAAAPPDGGPPGYNDRRGAPSPETGDRARGGGRARGPGRLDTDAPGGPSHR